MRYQIGDKVKVYGSNWHGVITKILLQEDGSKPWYELRVPGYGLMAKPEGKLVYLIRADQRKAVTQQNQNIKNEDKL